MVPMGCETRRCRGRCASGRVCHVVPRRQLARCRRPGGRPVGRVGVGRYYDPQTSQFLSVDPLVDETGQPYAYTGDDPVNAIDPLGLCWPSFACGVEHAIGGAATSAWNASGGQVVHYVDQHGTAIGLIVAGVVVVAGATVLTGGLADAAFLAADAAAEEGAAASLEFNMTILAHGAFVFGPGLLAGGFGLASIGYGAWQLATARSVALSRCPS
jgi:hypothetical protein